MDNGQEPSGDRDNGAHSGDEDQEGEAEQQSQENNEGQGRDSSDQDIGPADSDPSSSSSSSDDSTFKMEIIINVMIPAEVVGTVLGKTYNVLRYPGVHGVHGDRPGGEQQGDPLAHHNARAKHGRCQTTRGKHSENCKGTQGRRCRLHNADHNKNETPYKGGHIHRPKGSHIR